VGYISGSSQEVYPQKRNFQLVLTNIPNIGFTFY